MSSAGVPVLLGALLLIEAGVPLPVPGDLLMILVGERAAAHAIPLWAAVLALEAVTVIGTSVLFLLARGPAQSLLRRVGPRVGLTAPRLQRAGAVLEGRGQMAVAAGRAMPGLRTVTVLATAGTQLRASRALLLLVLGGSVFLQLHLVLGYLLGPVARDALGAARTPTIVALVALALAAVTVWIVRRGRRGAEASAEASCPACLAVGLLATRNELSPPIAP